MQQLKIAIYLRLSREDDQYGESNSINNQRKLLLDYTERIFGNYSIEIFEYVDDGYSGNNFDRPDFKRMIKDSEKNKIDIIMTKDLSRLGRDYIETGCYLEQVFPFLGIRFIAVNDKFDSNNFGGNRAGLEIGFKNLINEMYCKEASDKVKEASMALRKQGLFLGGTAPYGYVMSKENKHNLVVDQEAAEVVQRIFAMCLAEVPKAEIVRVLNKEGISPPGKYLQQKFGRLTEKNLDHTMWTRQSVYRILQNQVYIGKLVFGRRRKENMSDKVCVNVPRSEWMTADSHHEPIIEEHIFKKTNDNIRQEAEKRKRKKPLPIITESSLFERKLYCGYCHRSLRKRVLGNVYFQCIWKYSDSSAVCGKSHLNLKMIEEIVLTAMNLQMMLADGLESSLMKKYDTCTNKIYSKKLAGYDEAVTKIKRCKSESYEKYCLKKISLQEYSAVKQEYEQQISHIEALKKTEEGEQRVLQNSEAAENQYLKILDGKDAIQILTRELIDLFIDKINYYENNRIEIIWNFRVMNEMIKV